jgi:hypothetical protein
VDAGLAFDGFTDAALFQKDHPESKQFLNFLNSWTQLTAVLNELSRAMGLADFYPFVLSREAVRKMGFIHEVAHATLPHRVG